MAPSKFDYTHEHAMVIWHRVRKKTKPKTATICKIACPGARHNGKCTKPGKAPGQHGIVTLGNFGEWEEDDNVPSSCRLRFRDKEIIFFGPPGELRLLRLIVGWLQKHPDLHNSPYLNHEAYQGLSAVVYFFDRTERIARLVPQALPIAQRTELEGSEYIKELDEVVNKLAIFKAQKRQRQERAALAPVSALEGQIHNLLTLSTNNMAATENLAKAIADQGKQQQKKTKQQQKVNKSLKTGILKQGQRLDDFEDVVDDLDQFVIETKEETDGRLDDMDQFAIETKEETDGRLDDMDQFVIETKEETDERLDDMDQFVIETKEETDERLDDMELVIKELQEQVTALKLGGEKTRELQSLVARFNELSPEEIMPHFTPIREKVQAAGLGFESERIELALLGIDIHEIAFFKAVEEAAERESSLFRDFQDFLENPKKKRWRVATEEELQCWRDASKEDYERWSNASQEELEREFLPLYFALGVESEDSDGDESEQSSDEDESEHSSDDADSDLDDEESNKSESESNDDESKKLEKDRKRLFGKACKSPKKEPNTPPRDAEVKGSTPLKGEGKTTLAAKKQPKKVSSIRKPLSLRNATDSRQLQVADPLCPPKKGMVSSPLPKSQVNKVGASVANTSVLASIGSRFSPFGNFQAGDFVENDADVLRAIKLSQQHPGYNSHDDDVLHLPSDWRGLENFGNICYANSVFQCLFSLDSFTRQLSLAYAAQLKKTTLLGSVENLWHELNEKSIHSPASVRTLKGVMDKLRGDFRGYDQHCAHAFMQVLVDELEEEVMKYNETTAPERVVAVPTKCFDFKMNKCATCTSCGVSRVMRTEVHRDICLPVAGAQGFANVSVTSLLQSYFTTPEEIVIDCPNPGCDGKTAEKKLTLASKPTALTVVLNRLIVDEPNYTDREAPSVYSKREDPVDLDTVVSLEPFVDKTASVAHAAASASMYRLKAIVSHPKSKLKSESINENVNSGNQRTADSGHYIADALRGDAWVHFDDARTTHTTLPDIVNSVAKQKSAVMLLYELTEDANAL